MKIEGAVAPGIYRMDNGSYRVVARVGDRKKGPPPKERRFPANMTLKKMKAWQEDVRAELRRQKIRPVLGTLAADVDRYLAKPEVTRLASSKTRLSDTRAWLSGFGHLRRDDISAEQVQQQTNRQVA